MASYALDEKIDVGRVMQRGFETIARNAAGFILLSVALAGVPTFALYWIVLSSDNSNPETMFAGPMALINLALWLLSVFTSSLLNAALVRTTILDLSGRPADLQGSTVTALSLVLPMIGLAIATTVGFFLGLLLLIVPGIMFYIMWIVAVPVLVEERAGVFGSMSRSAELTSGSRWRIFGLIIIFLFFVGAVTAVTQSVARAGGESAIVLALVEAIAATIQALFAAAMIASLYFELRTVKEGATADSLADVFA